jgi:hypothetical protein
MNNDTVEAAVTRTWLTGTPRLEGDTVAGAAMRGAMESHRQVLMARERGTGGVLVAARQRAALKVMAQLGLCRGDLRTVQILAGAWVEAELRGADPDEVRVAVEGCARDDLGETDPAAAAVLPRRLHHQPAIFFFAAWWWRGPCGPNVSWFAFWPSDCGRRSAASKATASAALRAQDPVYLPVLRDEMRQQSIRDLYVC